MKGVVDAGDSSGFGREVEALARDVLIPTHGKNAVFNENGAQGLSPKYMIDIRAPQVALGGRWYAAPARPPEEP